jgi:hypothetical protein
LNLFGAFNILLQRRFAGQPKVQFPVHAHGCAFRFTDLALANQRLGMDSAISAELNDGCNWTVIGRLTATTTH